MFSFSILQSVYKNDKSEYLIQCFESIKNATIAPTEIILVKDGYIPKELSETIEEWKNKLPITLVGYEENKGLAQALNYGLNYVKTDIVARMDSDDIIYPDRFEKQLKYLEQHTDVVLLSGYIDEFNVDPNVIESTRKDPL